MIYSAAETERGTWLIVTGDGETVREWATRDLAEMSLAWLAYFAAGGAR